MVCSVAGDCNSSHLGIVNLNLIYDMQMSVRCLYSLRYSCEAAADYEIDCKAIFHTSHALRSVYQGQFARVNLVNTGC